MNISRFKPAGIFLLIFLAILTLSSCISNSLIVREYSIPVYEKVSELGITAVPEEMGRQYTDAFDRYTEIIAPNGGAIRIVAQNRITNEQIIRSRNILKHYLTNVPETLYGNEKSAVADRMAENGAVLALLNYRDDGSNKTRIHAQYLFEEELPVEGDTWYIENQYEEHRDAAFEEILHLVHDYGIGVDGNGGNPGALPEYQKKIRAAQETAYNQGIWAVGMSPNHGQFREWSIENSLTQEYLASVIDSWYGLWGAWIDPLIPESTERGMWGFYLPKTRREVEDEDPEGCLIAKMFFPEYLSYNARIDPSFSGIFHLEFDKSIPYTYKSQYLKDITLTGTLDSSISVNPLNNVLTGNSGNNAVIFSGSHSEYSVMKQHDEYLVTDKVIKRDGTNKIKGFEKLVFIDKTIIIE